MTDKLMRLFQDHLKAKHDIVFYDYQLEVARRIFEALISNLRLTVNASKEDVQSLRQIEVPIEFSRQSGKTTTIVHAIDFIMCFFPKIFDRKIEIGIFAPQKEQAKTDFDRLKACLRRTYDLIITNDESEAEAKEESNAKTIVVPNGKGASCYIFPVSKTSRPESKSLDLIVFEESQDLDDNIVKEQIWPMGKFTNAPRIYIGTAGVQICHFYRLVQGKDALILDFDKIALQKERVYDETGNPIHLIYIRSVEEDIEKYGRDADEIRRPYYLEWIIGTGQFVTQEALEEIESERKQTFHEKQHECFAGIDTAKNPDSTVCTILRYNPILKKKEVLNWLELNGDNYKNQFDIINEFLKKYHIVALAIDSTGQGDFMPDMFEAETEWRDENSGLYRVKFSQVSKDMIYKNLKVTIRELLTTLPKLDTKKGEKFKQQMLDLQQQYKGQLLSVHHPDDANAHDDYPDSWALAEWAYAKYYEHNNASITVLTAQKERKVVKHEGKVADYWPGDNGF
jgi:hypothetical protein